jgi:hypothetical protein
VYTEDFSPRSDNGEESIRVRGKKREPDLFGDARPGVIPGMDVARRKIRRSSVEWMEEERG